MAFGFLALNNERKVLISSDTKNLFYYKMATYNGVTATSSAGGPSIRLSYRVASAAQPIPFFTHPWSTYSISKTASFTVYAGTPVVMSWSQAVDQGLEGDDLYFLNSSRPWFRRVTPYYVQISLNSSSGVGVGQIIRFDTGNGLVTAGTNYFIRSVSGNIITISLSRGGAIIRNATSSYVNTSGHTATVTNPPVFLSTTRVTFLGGIAWEIELLASTTDISVVPVVHIFTEYQSTMERKGSYGMLVKSNDGGITYDTRLNPLAIIATRNVIPPTNPYVESDSSIVSTLNAALSEQTASNPPGLHNGVLNPDNSSTYLLSNILPASPIYFYMSIAQTYKRWNSYKDESYTYGSFDIFSGFKDGYASVHSYAYYQTFCRTGIAPVLPIFPTQPVTVSVGWTVVTIAVGGPTDGGYAELGHNARGGADGSYFNGSYGTQRADSSYFGGYTGAVLGGSIGTWATVQTINVKDQVVILADISRNI